MKRWMIATLVAMVGFGLVPVIANTAYATAGCAPTVTFPTMPGDPKPFQEGDPSYHAVLTETQDMTDLNHNWNAQVPIHVSQPCTGFTDSVWLGEGTCIPGYAEQDSWNQAEHDYTVKMTEPFDCMTVDWQSATQGDARLTYFFSAKPPQALLDECPMFQYQNALDHVAARPTYIYSDVPVVTGTDGPDLLCAYGQNQVVNSGDSTLAYQQGGSVDDEVWVAVNATGISVNLGVGNDVIYNHTDGTVVDGGSGADEVVNFASVNVDLVGADGTDVVRDVGTDPILSTLAASRTTTSASKLSGGPGADKLTTKKLADHVYGGSGSDTCTVPTLKPRWVRNHVSGCEKVVKG